MSFWKKLLTGLIGLSFLVLGLIAYALLTLNPNDYKQELSEYLNSKTGFNISFNGDIELQYFPEPSLVLRGVTVTKTDPAANIDGKIDQLSMQLNWSALLQKKIKIDALSVNKFDVRILSKDTAKNNSPKEKVAISKDTPKDVVSDKLMNVSLSKIHFEKGSMEIQNAQTKQKSTLSDFSFTANNLGVNSTMNFEGQMIAAVEGRLKPSNLSFKSTAKLQESSLILDKILVKGQIEPLALAKIAISCDANGRFDLTTQAFDGNYTLKLNDDALSGMFKTQTKPSTKIRFTLNAPTLDIVKLQTGKASTKRAKNMALSPALKANFNFNQPYQIAGEYQIDQLLGPDVYLSHLLGKISIQEETTLLNVQNIDAYEGKIKTDITLKGASIAANGEIKAISLQSLLTEFKDIKKFSGKLNSNYQIQTTGNTVDARLKALKGGMDFTVDNAIIEGIDIRFIFHELKAKLKQKTNTVPDTKQTPIMKAVGHLDFNDGMVSTQNLTLLSNDYRAIGEGTFAHADKYLKLYFDVTKLNDEEEVIREIPIGIKVYGHVPNIHIKPDYEGYAVDFAKKTITRKAEKALDKLTDKISDKLGLPAESEPGDTSGNEKQNLEDKINDKVKDKINKFLDKL